MGFSLRFLLSSPRRRGSIFPATHAFRIGRGAGQRFTPAIARRIALERFSTQMTQRTRIGLRRLPLSVGPVLGSAADPGSQALFLRYLRNRCLQLLACVRRFAVPTPLEGAAGVEQLHSACDCAGRVSTRITQTTGIRRHRRPCPCWTRQSLFLRYPRNQRLPAPRLPAQVCGADQALPADIEGEGGGCRGTGAPAAASTRPDQAAAACCARGPSFSARPTIATSRSSSSLVMVKVGVKRSELTPPWITPMPCSRSHSSVEPSP